MLPTLAVDHRCNPDAGFDDVLRSLGVDPARVDLGLLPPAHCPHRLTAPYVRRGVWVGVCRRCTLDVMDLDGKLVHEVPVEPSDTRGERWLAAQQHKPSVRELGA